jgi:hypothetical protein
MATGWQKIPSCFYYYKHPDNYRDRGDFKNLANQTLNTIKDGMDSFKAELAVNFSFKKRRYFFLTTKIFSIFIYRECRDQDKDLRPILSTSKVKR